MTRRKKTPFLSTDHPSPPHPLQKHHALLKVTPQRGTRKKRPNQTTQGAQPTCAQRPRASWVKDTSACVLEAQPMVPLRAICNPAWSSCQGNHANHRRLKQRVLDEPAPRAAAIPATCSRIAAPAAPRSREPGSCSTQGPGWAGWLPLGAKLLQKADRTGARAGPNPSPGRIASTAKSVRCAVPPALPFTATFIHTFRELLS